MTYDEFVTHVTNPMVPADWRYGQFVFNILNRVRPDLANAIRSTANDPFYDNRRVPNMLAWVAEHWDDPA